MSTTPKSNRKVSPMCREVSPIFMVILLILVIGLALAGWFILIAEHVKL
jgi:hypothetical protein